MEKKDVIKNELTEISPLIAAIDNINLYSVPDNYFNHLPEAILHRKNTHPLISNIEFPYEVPVDYFNNLSGNILQAIKANEIQEELQTVSPLLATIGNKNHYSVPPDYFNQLVVPVNKEKAKVVAISQRNWMKYAAAAVLAGAMALGGIWYANQRNNQIGHLNVNESISKLSDNEIMDYLNTHDASYEINASQHEDKDIQQSLDSMSEDEIQNYLQTNHEPGETVLKGI